MNTRIYYFSGTGNSLHIAKELRKSVSDTELVPMVGAINSGNLEAAADTVGFIFPIHCLGIPAFVKRFLGQISLKTVSYAFAITSRECSAKVFFETDKIISRRGKRLDACFSIQMPQTYLPMFEVDSKEEADKKEAGMLKALAAATTIIAGRKKHLKPDPKELGMYVYYAARPIIMFMYDKTKYFNLANRLYADPRCTGCGLCVRICLAGRVEMKNGRPAWNPKIRCLLCFACIHYCPARAVQIKNSRTAIRGRYHHPAVSAEEISGQKTA